MPAGKSRSRASARRPRPKRRRSPEGRLTVEELADLCASLCEYLGQESLDEGALPSIRAVAVIPGQTLARSPLVASGPKSDHSPEPSIPLPFAAGSEEIECDSSVELTPDGDFRACRYGYLCLQDGRLSVLSPLRLSPDAMHLHWIIPTCDAHPVTCEMILECACDLEVTDQLGVDQVEGLCSRLQAGKARPGLVEIATGIEPRSSADAAFEILVDVERRAGALCEDGSIDFRQVNFAPTVSAGQLVAQRLPGAPDAPGRDLRGNAVAADGSSRTPPVRAGGNLRTQPNGETEEYYATIDGLVRLSEDGVLSVANVLTIKSDISFHTGNVTFDGEIFIDGSVSAGFAVDGSGSVSITGTVEPGSSVKSKGDITVAAGIVGSRTRVAADGDLQAQFVQEARVAAGGDISLGSFAYHARLYAGGSVTVINGSGQRRGSILGGETWAGGAIDIRSAGTISGSDTILVAGLTPGQSEQLEKATRGAETSYEHVLRILRQFGLTRMDVAQVRNLIKASTGPRRKLLANRARQLGQLAQVYQTLLTRKQELRDTIAEAAQGARIRVSDSVRMGVQIRVGEYRRVLKADVTSPCFHISDNQLVER